MATIDDLKKNNVGTAAIDSTSDDIIVDMTSTKAVESSISHNEEVYNNRPKGKTIITQPNTIKGPDGKIYNVNNKNRRPANNSRVAFDLTKLPEDKKQDEDIHESIENDILTGKNPILYDYIEEKKKEMEQWVEEKDSQRELKQVEAEQEGVVIDLTTAEANKDLELKKDDSLSFDKFEKNENQNDEENVTYNIIDDLDLGDNSGMENTDTEKVNEEVVVETVKENTDDTIENDTVNSTDEEVTTTTESTNELDSLDDVKDDTSVEETDLTENNTDADEVESTPEEDTSVYADGIELQETEGIKQSAIIIEDEDEKEDSKSNSLVDELEPGAKHLIELASRVLKPAAKKLDLSSFTVIKKPVSNNRFFEQKQINVGKWVLRTKKVCVHMKASQGAELEELRVLMQTADAATDYIRMYRIIYDHIVSPKPNSFEAWCKSNYVDDIDDYFFAFFIANYKGSNHLPYDCPNKNCDPGTFLSDNIPIMNMVKFNSDKDKEEFNNIYKSEIFDTNTDGLYATERIAFSDRLAIGFKETTIYSFIEAQSIRNNEAFINKYSATIALTPNIDEIYSIDVENQNLYPIQYKIYPDSNANTYKSKIQKYDSVLRSLNPDEFATLSSYVATFTNDKKKAIGIKYIRPAATCPDCGSIVTEEETLAQSLVFIRYQLGQMVNISTK